MAYLVLVTMHSAYQLQERLKEYIFNLKAERILYWQVLKELCHTLKSYSVHNFKYFHTLTYSVLNMTTLSRKYTPSLPMAHESMAKYISYFLQQMQSCCHKTITEQTLQNQYRY
jgi:hypothetical protein